VLSHLKSDKSSECLSIAELIFIKSWHTIGAPNGVLAFWKESLGAYSVLITVKVWFPVHYITSGNKQKKMNCFTLN
jgi:hypothetical protein